MAIVLQWGTVLILTGVFGSLARRKVLRALFLSSPVLEILAEFHIFCCSGTCYGIISHLVQISGGIVSISFWSMVAVVASGVLGDLFAWSDTEDDT
ncbi:MAG: hypothetical protein IPG79_18595 [Saprospiraceae bacterium]|nr:hypothetical protein [Saprospiraceae bacterium]